MNLHIATAALVFVVATAPAVAQESTSSLPTVRAEAVLHVFDCDHSSLPTQREVGEWTGQRNFSQVYDTRARLMGDIARACRKPGVERVGLVMQCRSARPAAALRQVALAEAAR